MFLGFLGLMMIVIIVWALIQSKTNPVPIFVIVPIIAAVIAGFGPEDIYKFVQNRCIQNLVYCGIIYFLYRILLINE